MNNIDDAFKKTRAKGGRPKKPPFTEEEKRIRKNKNLKYYRDYYRRKFAANPKCIRRPTTYEKKRKTQQRQALLQAKSGTDKAESEEQIQGKNEGQGISVQLFSKTEGL